MLSRLSVLLLSLLPCLPTLAEDLTVSAAASLTDAFGELAPMFEAQHPGTKVLLNFGASGTLLQQIANGAPADVFVSADADTMDQAQAEQLVRAEERHDLVGNTLVLIIPAASTHSLQKLEDINTPAIKHIAIGNPDSVPVGRYSKKVLEQAGLWTAVEPKLANAQNVRQALDYVARGEVDAGFVYATDAAMMPAKVRTAFVVPTTKPIVYPIAPLAASGHHAVAVQFVEFTRSAPAQAILVKYGFRRL